MKYLLSLSASGFSNYESKLYRKLLLKRYTKTVLSLGREEKKKIIIGIEM